MARFNRSVSSRKVENLAGGQAFKESPELALVSLVLTSFVQDKFYRSAADELDALEELIDQNDKKFVAQTAVYAREKFYMRSITHVIAAGIAKRVKGEKWTKNFYARLIQRPDDGTEILSYYLSKYAKPIPNSLKKGLAIGLQKFDAYQLAKYQAKKKDVKMVDFINLVHPHPTEAIGGLMKGTIQPANTWETKLSAAGKAENKEEAKAEVWKTLLESGKLGYFALLRNLRNIIEQAPDLSGKAAEMLMEERLIDKSKILPFRFMTAQAELEKLAGPNARLLLGALSNAINSSLRNVPKLDGDTLVALDESGSMLPGWTVSKTQAPIKTGSLFAAVLAKANNADIIMFDEDARYINYDPATSVMSLADRLLKEAEGGGTDLNSVFELASRKYDRIVVLSDEQSWVSYHTPSREFAAYRMRTGANPTIYSFDLSGYGTLQFPESKVYAIAGFSDKVFEVMKLLESDRQALINEIKRIEL